MSEQLTKDNNMSTYRNHRYSGVRPAKQPNTWIIDYIDHIGKRHQKSYRGTESEAVKVRRGFLVKVDRIKAGLEAPPQEKTVVTFNDLWVDFYDNRKLKVESGSMAPKSLERYQTSVTALYSFRAALKNTRLERIRSRDLEAFKIHRKNQSFSPVGINTILRNLRTIFKYAVDHGHLHQSPFHDVMPLTTRKHDVRFLNEDELQALFVMLNDLDLNDQYQKDAHDLVIFLLFTGARLSEILFPTFDWICVGTNEITFPATKSSKSRVIHKIKSIDAILETRRHIFSGPFSLTGNEVYKRVKYVFKCAGIENASPHTLRKTAGAWYYIATRDIFAASRFLGHSSVKVTEQHYAGLIQSLQTEYSVAFEQAINSKLQLGCNLQTIQDHSRLMAENEKSPVSRRESELVVGVARRGFEPLLPA